MRENLRGGGDGLRRLAPWSWRWRRSRPGPASGRVQAGRRERRARRHPSVRGAFRDPQARPDRPRRARRPGLSSGAKVAAFAPLDATDASSWSPPSPPTCQRSGRMAPPMWWPSAIRARRPTRGSYAPTTSRVAGGRIPTAGGGAAFERRCARRSARSSRPAADRSQSGRARRPFLRRLFAAHVAAEHPDAFAGYRSPPLRSGSATRRPRATRSPWSSAAARAESPCMSASAGPKAPA